MDDVQWAVLQRNVKSRSTSAYEKNADQRNVEVVQNALKCGYLKVLDAELILASQECARLDQVLRISLPRWHIQSLDGAALSECTRLTICNLSSCYIRDITALRSCANLLKLDLSNNQIVEIPDVSFWSTLRSLHVLYLHRNAISDKDSALKINGCSQLHVLTLYNTPFSLLPGYRHNVINSILSLKALDRYVISDEEVVENLRLEGKFKSFSANFKMQLYQPLPQSISFEDERLRTIQLLQDVEKTLSKFSPVLIIQRYFRGWLVRRASKGNHNQSGAKPRQEHMHMKGPQLPRPASQVGKEEHQHHLAPPPTPSVPQTPQGGELRQGNSPSTKHCFPQKKHTLHVDLHTGAPLEQAASEVHVFQTSLRPQTPRSRPSSLKSRGKWTNGHRIGASAPVDGPTVAGRLDSLKPSVEGSLAHEKLAFLGLEADGQSVDIRPIDWTKEVTKSRQLSAKMIRDTEREIAALLSKQTHQKVHTLPALRKDQLLLVSPYVSMPTSAIKALEDLSHMRKKDEEFAHKSTLVARMKDDRANRAEHIEAYRQSLKKGIHAWKDHHIQVLLKKKRIVAAERNLIASLHAARRDSDTERAQLLKKDRQFEVEFNMQNTAIGCAMADEDKKTTRDVHQRIIKVMVEERREARDRGAAFAKNCLQRREAGLIEKNVATKKELKAKMCQMASQDQSEAKARVAKVKTHKAPPKEVMPLTKGTSCLDPPTSARSPELTPRRSYRGWVSSRQACRSSQANTSAHLAGTVDNSWEESKMEGHFPVFESPDTSCFMFRVLKPTAVFRRNPWQPQSVTVGT